MPSKPARTFRLTVHLIWVLMMAPLLADAQDVPEEGARFDYRHWRCVVDGNRFREQVSDKVTIFNERGQDFADLAFSEDSHNKLKAIKIRVLDTDGVVVFERRKNDLEKACGFGRAGYYDDVCTRYGTFRAQRFPYSVEYEYETESNSLFYLRGCVFQTRIPVLDASFSLLSEKTEIASKTYGLAESVTPVVGEDGRSRVWRLKDIPALEDIDYLPPGSREPARLRLTPERFALEKYRFAGGTWAGIGQWLEEMYRDRYQTEPDDAPAESSGSGHELARAIYESVTTDVRYVAIEVGVGGWRPYAASLTEKRGFGDCKDMATLLISRLRHAGIEATPVFVRTRNEGPMDAAFPNFDFNHVITLALVDNDSVWLDATCRDCPYGELPRGDEDIEVLVQRSGGARVCRTPGSTAADNTLARTTRGHIGADGIMRFQTELRATGNFALSYRHRLPDLDADETRRYVDNRFSGAGKQFLIDSYEIENLDHPDLPVIIRIEATMRKAARRIGGTLYCSPFVLSKLGGFEIANLDEREYPLNLFYPETESEEITISWDSALGVDSVVIPSADSLAYPFADVTLEGLVESDRVRFALSKRYHVYQVEPERFEDLLEFRKRTKKLLNGYVKLFVAAN